MFAKWGLDFAVIGRLTEGGRLVLRAGGKVVAEMPVDRLVGDAPRYRRPWVETPPRPDFDPASLGVPVRTLHRRNCSSTIPTTSTSYPAT